MEQLITQRSLVQIQPPQPRKGRASGAHPGALDASFPKCFLTSHGQAHRSVGTTRSIGTKDAERRTRDRTGELE